ncbi:MAG: hypothetical protein ACKO23_06960 [Gemmataceae bacterium]
MAMPPHLASFLHQKLSLKYLQTIKLSHNYHFRTNRVGQPEAALEFRLENDDGETLKTIRYPDPKASSFLRRRQGQLAQLFIDDQPYQTTMIEKIAAPNAVIPEATIWEQPVMDQRKLVLTTMPENEIPRDRQVFRPSSWSLLVMRSLGRYLQRNNESAHVSLTRISKEPIPPRVLFEKESPPEMEPLKSSYGRLSK